MNVHRQGGGELKHFGCPGVKKDNWNVQKKSYWSIMFGPNEQNEDVIGVIGP